MAYQKRNFKKDQLLTADDLNAMDDQIASNEESAKKANDDIKNKLDKSAVVKEKGDSETAVMSQAAATIEFNKLSEEIDDVKTELGVSPNLANPNNFVKGYNWRPENNVQSASSNYFYMPLKVNEGDIISVSHLTYIAAFDSDGQVVESAGVYNNETDAGNHGPYTYTVPNGIVKIIISSRLAKIDKFMVNYGELLDYVPYNQFSRITGIENELKRCYKDDMPTYYTEYLFGKIRTIQSISQSYDYVGDTFAFVTDYHAERNAGISPLLLKKIAEETNVGFVAQNGDLIDGANEKSKMLNLMQDTINKFKAIPCRVFSVYGNHDNNSHGGTEYKFTNAEYYGICQKIHEQSVDGIQTARLIYYVDNTIQKIRYFFLNSELSNNSTAVMCQWLETALNGMPSGYGAVFFMHRSYQRDDSGNYTIETRCQMILDVLDAFNTGGTVNLSDYSTIEGTVSFVTKQNNTRALIVFAGHTHKDYVTATNGGLPVCITTCDFADSSVGRSEGTTDEQAFDIITLDLNGNKAYCTRIGSGSDRVIDLYSIS